MTHPAPVQATPRALYRTIVADPPWPYDSPGDNLRASRDHRPNSWNSDANTASSAKRYGAMPIADLCALQPGAETNAHLYLWTTNSFIVEAHAIAESWGFKPKTVLTYGKVTPEGKPSARVGYYFRGATEHIVFAVRGSQPLLVSEAVPNLWLWPRLPHSVKPDAFFDLVERVSPGPYLEMFSRRARLGWDTWGHEALHDTETLA